MTPEMSFECVLFSQDPSVFCPVDHMLHDLSVCTNICSDSTEALDLLAKGGTDLVVIDCGSEVSSELLQEVWRLQVKRKPTVVAVSREAGQIPGAHVVMQKPVSTQSGMKSLKSAYERMLMDYRRHARYALMSSVQVTTGARTFRAIVTDIGEGGVGLSTREKMTIGDEISFHLPLHGAKREIYIEARVLWFRDYGRVGCDFLRIPPVDRNILLDWLASKVQIKQPVIPM